MTEEVFTFQCEGESLVGILHRGDPKAVRGVIIIVAGGPQYRAGAHRQQLLLGRRLSARGTPVLRFDYRGMGDSGGLHRGFEHISADIAAAVEALIDRVPTLKEVVLWGECDSSAAITFYAYKDQRIKGITLINPWVRTDSGRARTVLKHYYIKRLLEPEFWKKMRDGKLEIRKSAGSLVSSLLLVIKDKWGQVFRKGNLESDANEAAFLDLPIPERFTICLKKFSGQVLLIMSGRDYIAREFDEIVAIKPELRKALESDHVKRFELKEADHTFSRRDWRDQVATWTESWIASW